MVFVLIGAVAMATVGRFPGVTDPTAVVEFLEERRMRVLVGSVIAFADSFLFLWFLAGHRRFLRRIAPGAPACADVAVMAGVTTVALVLVGVVLLAAAAFVAPWPPAHEHLARGLYAAALVCVAGATYPTTAAFVSATAAASLRDSSGVVPQWLGWSGVILASAQVLATTSILSRTGPFGLGGAFPSMVFLTFLSWVLVNSVVGARGTRPERVIASIR